MTGIRLVCEHLAGLPAQDVDVALSAALGDHASALAQRCSQASEQPLVVGDPVERGRREDRVDGLRQLELEQVGDADIHVRTESLAGGGHHRGRLVDRDHAPARQPLDQRLGYTPRAAAGVEHGLIAAQLQALEHRQPKRLHRPGDTVVTAPVPLAYWHTSVRYHVPPARAASPRSTRESCPPCQAIGERIGRPSTLGSSTTNSAPSIARA